MQDILGTHQSPKSSHTRDLGTHRHLSYVTQKIQAPTNVWI